MSKYDIQRDFECQNRILHVKTKNEKRKTNNEQRKSNSEKRITKNEKRKTKNKPTSHCCIKFQQYLSVLNGNLANDNFLLLDLQFTTTDSH